MSASNIEWTDETWQVTNGCTEKSSGCAGCYARRMSKRLGAMAKADVAAGRDPGKKASYALVVDDAGRWTGVVPMLPAALAEPFGWRRPRTVFVDSMSDLFWGDDEDLADARRRGVADPQAVPFEFIASVFGVMDACDAHTFQVLTKRIGRAVEFHTWLIERSREFTPHGPRWSREATFCSVLARSMLPIELSHRLSFAPGRWPLGNVIMMTSVENQRTADERIPLLLRCPATRRGLSMEPLLGPVDITTALPHYKCDAGAWRKLHHGPSPQDGVDCGWRGLAIPDRFGGDQRPLKHCVCPGCWEQNVDKIFSDVNWVIVGGESGPTARPMHPAWARSLRDQCHAAGVPFFFKQWGEFAPFDNRLHGMMTSPDDYRINGRAVAMIESAARVVGTDEVRQFKTPMIRVGKHAAGRLLDGVEHNAMPPASAGRRERMQG